MLYEVITHLPYMPQGKTISVSTIGRPTSPPDTTPEALSLSKSFRILVITVGEKPVVYELTNINNGCSDNTPRHCRITSYNVCYTKLLRFLSPIIFYYIFKQIFSIHLIYRSFL